MSELEDRINAVLGDPKQMEKITMMAKSLMGASGQEESPAVESDSFAGLGIDPAMIGRISRLMSKGAEEKLQERALLEAMKPYLSEKRRGKMDRAIKLARLTQIARLALGEMGGDGNDKPL